MLDYILKGKKQKIVAIQSFKDERIGREALNGLFSGDINVINS